MKRILSVIMLTILFLSMFGCTSKAGLESGFTYKGDKPLPDFFLAFKSDKTEFDINDVTINISIGLESEFSPLDDPRYILKLIVVDEQNFVESTLHDDYAYRKTLTLLKECVDFSNKKFYYESEQINSRTFKVSFNHSEAITIPAEMFSQQSGVLKLVLYQEYPPSTDESDPECWSCT